MQRRQFTAGLFAPAAAGVAAALASGWPAPARALTQADAAAGVKSALERGANAAVDLLGRPDGFLGNPQLRIPLPGYLEDAAKLLRATGQGAKVDELVTAMNRAAEAAVPQARALLVQTVKGLTVQDALALVRGGETAVTDWFAQRTREPLARTFLPIVQRATAKVSLAERYNAVAGRLKGLVKGDAATIEQHVTARALDALYRVIGQEEKKLRADPVGAGSDLLRRVFGR